MGLSRPPVIEAKHLKKNGKLYSDAEIKQMHEDILHLNPLGMNGFLPRFKKNKSVKRPFSVALMDDELYAIYMGVKHGKHIGAGNFGKVKYAQNLKSGEWVALKVIKKADSSLKNEVKINSLVNNTPTTLYNRVSDTSKRWQYEFIMPLARGVEAAKIFLDDSISSKLSQHDKFEAGLAILKAFKKIHDCNVLHCDIKLENIIYDIKTKEATVIDFGLSLIGNPGKLEQAANYRGTPFTNAPEIRMGQINLYNEQTEVYSLGVSLAEVFRYPLVDKDKNDPLNKIHSNYREIVATNNTDAIEVKLVELINAMINEDPTKRPKLEDAMSEVASLRDNLVYQTITKEIAVEYKRLSDMNEPEKNSNKIDALLKIKEAVENHDSPEDILNRIQQYHERSEDLQTKVGKFFKGQTRGMKFASHLKQEIQETWPKKVNQAAPIKN